MVPDSEIKICSFALHYIVLYCFVGLLCPIQLPRYALLHCIVLHYIVLQVYRGSFKNRGILFALPCIVLYRFEGLLWQFQKPRYVLFIALYRIVLYCIVLYCIVLYCIVLCFRTQGMIYGIVVTTAVVMLALCLFIRLKTIAYTKPPRPAPRPGKRRGLACLLFHTATFRVTVNVNSIRSNQFGSLDRAVSWTSRKGQFH